MPARGVGAIESAAGDRSWKLWACGGAGLAWGWPAPGRWSRAFRPPVPGPAGLGAGRVRRSSWWGPPGWAVRSVFGVGAGAFGGYAAAAARLSRATGSVAPAAEAPPTRVRTASTSAASTVRVRCAGAVGVIGARCGGAGGVLAEPDAERGGALRESGAGPVGTVGVRCGRPVGTLWKPRAERVGTRREAPAGPVGSLGAPCGSLAVPCGGPDVMLGKPPTEQGGSPAAPHPVPAGTPRKSDTEGVGSLLEAPAGPVCHGRGAVSRGAPGCGVTSVGRAGRRWASLRGGAPS